MQSAVIDPIVVFPLRGECWVVPSPGHHQYAFDFALVGGPARRSFSKPLVYLLVRRASVTDSYSWSAPVYAPFDGEVVQASDGWPDQVRVNLPHALLRVLRTSLFHTRKTENDLRTFAGNYVIVRTDTVHLFLAHLRCGSVQVAVGQHVTCGQVLARIGNSGASVAPHLHFHMMDSADPVRATIIPFRFRHYERWNGAAWEAVQNRLPVKGESIRLLAA